MAKSPDKEAPMSQPECLPFCDERHADDCPRGKAEHDYWRRYFGQDDPDREQRRRTLEAMRPLTAHERELALEVVLGHTPRKGHPPRERRDLPFAVGDPPGRCCTESLLAGCVCLAFWRCAEHGDRHVGTHD